MSLTPWGHSRIITRWGHFLQICKFGDYRRSDGAILKKLIDSDTESNSLSFCQLIFEFSKVYGKSSVNHQRKLDSEMCFSNFSISSIYKEKTSYRTLENRHRKMDFKFGVIDLELVYVRPLCCHRGTMNEISLVLLVLFCTFIEVETIKISFAVKF